MQTRHSAHYINFALHCHKVARSQFAVVYADTYVATTNTCSTCTLQKQLHVLHTASQRLAVFAAQSNGANGASKSSPYVSNPYAEELKETAKSISNRGRGILASDESNVTTGKRLASVGESTFACIADSMARVTITKAQAPYYTITGVALLIRGCLHQVYMLSLLTVSTAMGKLTYLGL